MNPVILNSLPKSGTHVLVRLFELLGYEDSKLHLSGSLVRPYYGRNIMKKVCKWGVLNIDQTMHPRVEVDLDFPKRTISQRRLTNYLRKIGESKFCEAHTPYSESLEQSIGSEGLKMIYIVRDPRDVALSYVNHVERDSKYPYHRKMKELGEMVKKIEFVLRGDSGGSVLSSLSDRVEKSAGWKHSASCCFVCFEDIIGVKGGGSSERQLESVTKIVKYIGLDEAKLNMENICERLFYRKAETFNYGAIGRHADLDSESIVMLNSFLLKQIELLGYAP